MSDIEQGIEDIKGSLLLIITIVSFGLGFTLGVCRKIQETHKDVLQLRIELMEAREDGQEMMDLIKQCHGYAIIQFAETAEARNSE